MAVSKLARSPAAVQSTIFPRGHPRFSRRHRARHLSRQSLFIIIPTLAIFFLVIAYNRTFNSVHRGLSHLKGDASSYYGNVLWAYSVADPDRTTSISDHTSEPAHDAKPVANHHDQQAHRNDDVKADHNQDQQHDNTPSSAHDSDPVTKASEQEQQQASSAATNLAEFPKISAVILFHSEYPTLNHTLETWEQNGLHTLIHDFVFFLNGIESTDEFDSRIPRLREPQWHGKVRALPSKENLPLGIAIRQMVELAKHEHVLLLEKDWALIEPLEEVRLQLSSSVSLIESGVAQVVRFRHRKRPGAPLYAQITYQGRENRILQRQTNLFCYMHHWIDNLDKQYDQYFTNCTPSSISSATATGNSINKKTVWCSKSRYCNWTNNPGIFSRTWFLKQLGDPFQRNYNETVKSDPRSNMLDFEFYTNWKFDIWNDRDYIIALPFGLFEHQEVDEQTIMNTVWHAWSRLSTDVSEKRAEYILTERKVCSSPNKSHSAGGKYAETFPLSFVHLYHYERAMERSVTEAIDELHTEAIKQRDLLREGHGSWRNGITELTNLWQKVSLFTYPSEPIEMTLSFVTAAYAAPATQNNITIAQVAATTVANLHVLRHYRNIVFTDAATKRLIHDGLRGERGWMEADIVQRVQFVEEELDPMLERVLSTTVMKRIEESRDTDKWKTTLTERLRRSDGDSSSSYSIPSKQEVALSLVPPLLLRDAEQRSSGRANVAGETWNMALRDTTHLIWFDAMSPCISLSSTGLQVRTNDTKANVNDHVLRGNMLLHALVTGRRISSTQELDFMLGGLSGFANDILLTETETRDIATQGLRVVDGRTLAGSRLAITLLAGYYDSVLTDMVVRRGALGTARELLTITLRNVEYNFEFFDAFEKCPDGEDCGPIVPLTSSSTASVTAKSGCRLYEWVSKCAVLDFF